jgi:hypothetical protein
MKRKNILLINRLLWMSLLLAGCASGQLSTSTLSVAQSSATHPMASLTPVIPVEIKSVTFEPQVLKNGDSFLVQVSAHRNNQPILLDLSQLDTVQKEPIMLGASGEDNFSGKFTVSYGNIAANGKKDITVTTIDETGKSMVATTQVELKNPDPILDKVPPNDNFDGSSLDWNKWTFDDYNGGKLNFQDGRLLLSTNEQKNSQARIYSAWKFPRDFDIQVDFEDGGDWRIPDAEHLDSAVLGIEVGEHQYHISRLMQPKYYADSVVMFAWGNIENIQKDKPITASVGRLRLIRTGGSLIYLFDVGEGWVELGAVAATEGPARVYMGIQSVDCSQVFKTYFDNFVINSGQTNR